MKLIVLAILTVFVPGIWCGLQQRVIELIGRLPVFLVRGDLLDLDPLLFVFLLFSGLGLGLYEVALSLPLAFTLSLQVCRF